MAAMKMDTAMKAGRRRRLSGRRRKWGNILAARLTSHQARMVAAANQALRVSRIEQEAEGEEQGEGADHLVEHDESQHGVTEYPQPADRSQVAAPRVASPPGPLFDEHP